MKSEISTYTTTNAAPPYRPTMYGKRQTLPMPKATPIIVMSTPKREANVSRDAPTGG
jgi:hypothetical protein